MKAIVQLEVFSDNIHDDLKLKSWICNNVIPGIGDATFGKMPKPWVAKITGKDPTYKYKREFLKSNKDYTHANSKGSRGIYLNYILESGNAYEINSQLTWNKWERYFCYVDDNGDIIRINKDGIDKWLQNRSILSE